MTSLTIGQLAKAANVNIATVRYYERCGLINKPQRTLSGYRLYSQDFIKRIHFIIKAKDFGFSLKEISELLVLQSNIGTSCAAVKSCTASKIQLIENKMQFLKKMKKSLIQLYDRCDGENLIRDCHILESLNE